MTEQEALTGLIERYKLRIHNNDFKQNPYYDSLYKERKEVLEKIKELETKKDSLHLKN